MIRFQCPQYLACLLALGLAGSAAASDEDLFSTSLEDLLGTTVSTASKYEQTAREAPASVTVVTAEDIRLYGYRTLDEILNSLPGFYVSNDRNYTYIGVRGFSRPTDYNNRMLLLLNGTTISEAVWGAAPLASDLGLNMDSVEKVEIVRGPGSSLYGTNAMFAVVNVITKSGNQVDGTHAAVEFGSFGTRGGSLNFGREFATGLDLAIAGTWQKRDGLDLFYGTFNDPATNNGIAENLDWEEVYGMSASASYGDFTAQAWFVERDKGIPTASYETDFNNPRSMSVDDQHMIGLSYERAIGARSQLSARTSHQYYFYKGDWFYDGENWPDDADGRSLRAELQLRHDLRPDNRLIGGVELQNHYKAEYRTRDPDRVAYYDGRHPYHVVSAYLQDEHQITSDLAATLGLRISDYSTVGTVVSPRGALVYHPGVTTSFKLLYGEAFRTPGMYEIEYEDREYGGFKGNADLESETVRTVELIWDQQLSPTVAASTSLYRSVVHDLVDQVVDPADELIQHQNLQEVSASGVEVGLRGRFADKLRGSMSYTFQRARDDLSDNSLSNVPSHMLKAGMGLSLGRGQLAPEVRYESSRRTVRGTRTGSYFLTNVRFVVDSSLGNSTAFSNQLTLSLTVRNLFDTDYSTPAGLEHEQPDIRQDGRGLTLRLEYHL